MANISLIDNRQIRVFISSTFQDMQEERDYLMTKVFPRLKRLASERDVMLTELDLRWGITEEEAQNGKVVEICLNEIDNSHPFFVGLVGRRYGWCPSNEELQSNHNLYERYGWIADDLDNGLSVTEIEMQYGVLRNPDNMNAFFFIKDSDDVDCDNPTRLKALKEEILNNNRYPVNYYSAVEELGKKVEAVFVDLLDGLFPVGNLTDLEKHRIAQRSFLNSLCQNYIKDESNFKALDDFWNDENCHCLVLTGESGIGKSALLANWIKEKKTNEKDFPILYYFVGNGSDIGDYKQIQGTLVDELSDFLGLDESDSLVNQLQPALDSETSKDKENKRNRLSQLFDQLRIGKQRVLIVLDAINQLADEEDAKLLNWLPAPTKNVKFLFSTLNTDRTMDVFSQRQYPIFTLLPLDLPRRRKLTIGYLNSYGKKMTKGQVERIVCDTQCENTLVLRTLLDELVSFGVYEQLDQRIEYYLHADSVEDFYQSVIQRFENDYSLNLVKDILSLIAASRNGLSENEIIELTETKPLYWSQFYCAFGNHLNVKNGLVTFSHQYIRNAIWQRYLKQNKEYECQCRKRIAELFIGVENARAFDELPFQYFELKQFQDLYDFIVDFEHLDYYSDREYELGRYWTELIANGYSLEGYFSLPIREKKGASDFGNLSIFCGETFSSPSYAIRFAEQSLACIEAMGDSVDYGKLWYSYFCLGYALLGETRFEESVRWLEKALGIIDQTKSKHDAKRCLTYTTIGLAYYDNDNFALAIEFSKKSLEIQEISNKKDDYEMANNYNVIGLSNLRLGNLHESELYLSKAIAIYTQQLGVEHYYTAMALNNMGLVYIGLGQDDKAIEWFEKAKTSALPCIPSKHNFWGVYYYNIGESYLTLGKKGYGEACIQKAIEIYASIYGEKHPEIARCNYILGESKFDRGQYEESIELFGKAKEIQVALLGENNLIVATCYQGLGKAYSELGQDDEALSNFQKSLPILLALFGENHPNVGISYNGIGFILLVKGELDQAENYFTKALKIWQQTQSNEYNLATIYRNLGILYGNRENLNLSREYLEQSLAIRSKLPLNLLSMADLYSLLCNVHEQLGELPKAEEYGLKYLDAFREAKGDCDDAVECLLEVSEFLDRIGKYNLAKDYLEDAFAMSQNVTIKDELVIARLFYQRGVANFGLKQYTASKNDFQKSLEICLPIVDANDSSLPDINFRIGTSAYMEKQFEEALEYFQKTKLLLKDCGGDDGDQIIVDANIGKSMYELHRFQEALRYLKRAKKTNKMLPKKNAQQKREIRRDILRCRFKLLFSK